MSAVEKSLKLSKRSKTSNKCVSTAAVSRAEKLLITELVAM